MDEVNLNIIRESYGRVVYTHKTYEKANDICISKSKRIKTVNVILLALTSGTAIGSFFKGNFLIIVTSLLSTFSLFFLVYQYNFNWDGLAQEYKDSANSLWYIREKYQNLIADIMNDRFSPEEITNERDSLLKEYHEILKKSPSTNGKAYSKAKKALKVDEEMTFSTKEIDNFLPEKLRLNKKP